MIQFFSVNYLFHINVQISLMFTIDITKIKSSVLHKLLVISLEYDSK